LIAFLRVPRIADSLAEGAGFELTVRFLATLKLKTLVRVDRSVASAANGNQVFLAIGSAMAAKAKVVYFDCRYGTAALYGNPI